MAAATLLMLAVLGVSAASAGAATVCESTLRAVTIYGDLDAGPGCVLRETTVNGNVTVDPAGSLELLGVGNFNEPPGTTVNGNLIVEPGGRLFTFGNVAVTGNVQARDARSIQLNGSIGGYVQFQGTTGQSDLVEATVKRNVEIQNGLGAVFIVQVSVGGNVQLQGNTGAFLNERLNGELVDEGLVELSSSRVGGNVEVHNNSPSGSFENVVAVANDSVGGNVHVHNNSETAGSGFNAVAVHSNEVGGNLDVHDNAAEGPAGSANLVVVSRNTITNYLACHNDTPPATDLPPFTAPPFNLPEPNTAKQKTGECEGL
jgi:hypothetical protein